MKQPVARAGMTLVEVLLALGIFSAVAVLLLSSFTGADRARAILFGRAAEFRRIVLAQDRLASDLAGAFSSQAVSACRFSAREDRFGALRASTLSFTAFVLSDSSNNRPSGDLVKIRYFPRQSEDGRFVELRREVSAFPLIESRAAARETSVARDLSGFWVEFWDGASWTRQWPPAPGKETVLPARAAIVLLDSRGVEYRRAVFLPLAGQEANLPYSGRRSKAP